MMMFREVKKALIEVLGDNSDGLFRVLGYQKQNKNSNAVKDNKRLVQVYYEDGQFPKSAGRFKGPKTHDLSYSIDVTCSSAAQGAVNVLNSESATAIQKAAALAEIKTAAERADESLDEVIQAVYQILMDARVSGIGLDQGAVSSRWIDRIQKDTTLENGDLVVRTANMKYSCRVQEIVSGEIGNEPDTVIYDTSLDGDVKSAGVKVENLNE